MISATRLGSYSCTRCLRAPNGGVAYPPSGKKFDRILFEPIEITDKLYLSDSEGGINALDVPPNRPGMFFWRVVGQ